MDVIFCELPKGIAEFKDQPVVFKWKKFNLGLV
jgi:hypothetical protein